MGITITRKDEADLTIFTVSGELSADEQIQALSDFYGSTPTMNAIWDFRGIEGKRISSSELRKIIAFSRQHSSKREGGKTALVTGTELDFALARMGEAYAEMEGTPWTPRTFKNIEEAEAWLAEHKQKD